MEGQYPRPQDTPTAASNHGSNNGGANADQATPSPRPPPPLTPRPVPKYCETYPTTFVQTDATSFKKVVQMLTGSAETVVAAAACPPTGKAPAPPAAPPPAAKSATGPKKPAFKLYERRNSLKNLKMISPLIPAFFNSNLVSPGAGAGAAAFSPRRLPEIPSPSTLDFPALSLSPVTPLIPDPFNFRPAHQSSEVAKWAEERAIAEKGFYLHPSPRGGAEPPRLLPLFPLTSPGASTSSSPSSVAVLSPSSP